MRRLVLAASLVAALALPARAADMPIFDAHLHYNEEAFAAFPLERVLELFRRNNVRGILANSRPNAGTHKLLDAKARGDLWVVPFLRPYKVRADRETWFKDPLNFAFILEELPRRPYVGIGEFHLSAAEAGGDQMRRLVDLAVERGLWLHAHTDEAGIATLMRHNPKAKIVWAHTGFGTSVETVSTMLATHPSLVCELSYRGGIVEGGDRLTAAWRDLFTRHPDRFLLGSDTWINERWASYSELMQGYRALLAQLPQPIAEKIAYRNAEALFGRGN
jgi:hypothetical protein